MSASLVGSEMCIRDRRYSALLCATLHHSALLCTTLHHSALLCATLRSVSYTHLTLPTICSV
eukprot:14931084-Alexandrium_andersonii.AAC.1